MAATKLRSLQELLSDFRHAHNALAVKSAVAGADRNNTVARLLKQATAFLLAGVALGDEAVRLERRHRLLGQCDAYRALLVATKLDADTVAALLNAAATQLAALDAPEAADVRRSA
jgi:hypothetical protein